MNVISAPLPTPLPFDEVLVRVAPARGADRASRRREGSAQQYDAYIYTHLADVGGDTGGAPPVPEEGSQHARQEIGGLPLAGVERIAVRWTHYMEYLHAFQEGIKGGDLMRYRLLDALSDRLEQIIQGRVAAPSSNADGVRVWWSVESAELIDLPWDLVAYGEANSDRSRVRFVRGAPGEWAPPVPLDGPLRLALVGHSRADDAEASLDQMPPGIQPVRLPDDPRLAVEIAAREGYELLHLTCDAFLTAGWEPIFYFGPEDANDPQVQRGALLASSTLPYTKGGSQSRHRAVPADRISVSEMAALLRGSRVTLVSLMARNGHQPFNFELVPALYRAFAVAGHVGHGLPSVAAEIGPMWGQQQASFWGNFYTALAGSLSIEEALRGGQLSGPGAPVALFLRDRLEHQFRPVMEESTREFAPPSAAQQSPNAAAAELQVLQSVLDDLAAIDSKYSEVPEPISKTDAYNEARAAQQRITEGLVDYTRSE